MGVVGPSGRRHKGGQFRQRPQVMVIVDAGQDEDVGTGPDNDRHDGRHLRILAGTDVAQQKPRSLTAQLGIPGRDPQGFSRQWQRQKRRRKYQAGSISASAARLF